MLGRTSTSSTILHFSTDLEQNLVTSSCPFVIGFTGLPVQECTTVKVLVRVSPVSNYLRNEELILWINRLAGQAKAHLNNIITKSPHHHGLESIDKLEG